MSLNPPKSERKVELVFFSDKVSNQGLENSWSQKRNIIGTSSEFKYLVLSQFIPWDPLTLQGRKQTHQPAKGPTVDQNPGCLALGLMVISFPHLLSLPFAASRMLHIQHHTICSLLSFFHPTKHSSKPSMLLCHQQSGPFYY